MSSGSLLRQLDGDLLDLAALGSAAIPLGNPRSVPLRRVRGRFHQYLRIEQHLQQFAFRLATERPLLRLFGWFFASALAAGAGLPPAVRGALLRDGGGDSSTYMAPYRLVGGEERSVVPFRFQKYYVEFRYEEEEPDDEGAQSDAHAHGDHLGVAPEVDGDESYPDNAGRVHGEADEFRFVEVFGNVAGFEGV